MFKPSFKPELLPFAAFFATIPLYSPNIVSFTNALGMASLALGCFVQAMLASAFVAGLGLAVASIGHAVDRVVAGRRHSWLPAASSTWAASPSLPPMG